MPESQVLQRTVLDAAMSAQDIDLWGVARADALVGQSRLQEWLDRDYQGQMTYLERQAGMRLDPTELLPGVRSVIVAYLNYYHPTEPGFEAMDNRISRYARGKDYHEILKGKLHSVAETIFPEVASLPRRARLRQVRVFVDSGPVAEKEWAVQAGLGWQGKHTNLINRTQGSWGFLGVILSTRPCDTYDTPSPDFCGTCTRCLDACPTEAFPEPYVLDARRCISYGTIELEADRALPDEIRKGRQEWIFGCDICQDVCPWNRKPAVSREDGFRPLGIWAGMDPGVFLRRLTETEFQTIFAESPLKRPGLSGLKRNLGS